LYFVLQLFLDFWDVREQQFINISMRNSLRRILRSLFLGWNCKTTDSYVLSLWMIWTPLRLLITTVERRQQQRFFRAWQKFQQQLSSRQQFLLATCYSCAVVCDL